MSIERARAHLAQFGLGERIIETAEPSATVVQAAAAGGTLPERIAKSLTFDLGEGVTALVVAAGDVVVDNRAFKDAFGLKARMLPAADLPDRVGFAAGGVCPFGVEPGVRVFLDASLRRFETVFPAAGSGNSAIELSLAELQDASGAQGWVEVTKPRA